MRGLARERRNDASLYKLGKRDLGRNGKKYDKDIRNMTGFLFFIFSDVTLWHRPAPPPITSAELN